MLHYEKAVESNRRSGQRRKLFAQSSPAGATGQIEQLAATWAVAISFAEFFNSLLL